MLDRLPDELVLLVVEELAPAPLVLKGYHEAQNTLRALCLTARRYRRLAQPVLWRNLVFTDLRRSAKFVDLEGVNTLRDHVQSLVVEPERDYDNDFAPAFDLSEVESILPLLPNLVGLRLDGRHKAWTVDCFDLASLAMNHNLRLLQLANLECTRTVARLPQLEQLHVEGVTVKPDDITNSLDSVLLPRLTALHVGDVYNPHDGHQYSPILLPSFIAQLEVIHTSDLQTVRDADLSPSPEAPPAALLCGYPAGVVPRHGLIPCDTWGTGSALRRLRRWTDQLVAAVPLLSREQSSFWLPYSVEAAAAESMDIWDALRDLGDACARAGRRLLWWEGELAEGELVSHEFWRYARVLRAARATAA